LIIALVNESVKQRADATARAYAPLLRHYERSEAIQGGVMLPWIASLPSQ
jgi:hypothetical protein